MGEGCGGVREVERGAWGRVVRGSEGGGEGGVGEGCEGE